MDASEGQNDNRLKRVLETGLAATGLALGAGVFSLVQTLTVCLGAPYPGTEAGSPREAACSIGPWGPWTLVIGVGVLSILAGIVAVARPNPPSWVKPTAMVVPAALLVLLPAIVSVIPKTT